MPEKTWEEYAIKIKEWYESYPNRPTWIDVSALLNRELKQERARFFEAVEKTILEEFEKFNRKSFEKTCLNKTSFLDVSKDDWESSFFTIDELVENVIKSLKEKYEREN